MSPSLIMPDSQLPVVDFRMLDDSAPWPVGTTHLHQYAPKPKDASILPLRKHIPPSKPRLIYRPEDDILVRSIPRSEPSTSEDSTPRLATRTLNQTGGCKTLNDLPTEIQECILDYTHGTLGSAACDGAGSGGVVRNWSRMMRHPRRKQLSDLSLVSSVWRRLIQQRMYRHIKVKGTKKELEECGDWFLNHPHLQSYVRHLEVWVPVWEMKSAERSLCLAMKAVAHDRRPPIAHRAAQSTWPNTGVNRFEEPSNISLAYQQATANATLDELLMYAKALFPEAYALTIEGGHCKKPPRIRFFRDTKLKACQSKNTPQQLPVLPNIRTLVLRGAWNIIRQDTDFHIISHAFPNLSEWQCAYSKPKTDGYIAMCAVLQYFPQTIVRLDLCLEGLYAKEITSLHKWHKLEDNHICLDLGRLGPQLESLSFTGRVCAGFFKSAIQCANLNLRNTPRLKSLDLIVKNCCMEDTWTWNSSTGINNWDFIRRFRALVTEGVRALKTYPRVSYMRIRFIDLDSINPLLNPYFHLQDTGMHKGKPRSRCTGVWNDEILELLQAARPGLGFEGMGEDGEFEMEGKWRVRPRNINFASYATLAEGPLS